MSDRRRVTAVVLAYGPEPLLGECVTALLASRAVDVDVVLVDNGCTTDMVDRLADRPGVHVVRPGRNTGFTGGCNLGAQHAQGEIVAFVNSDAVVEPDALAALAGALGDPAVGLATAGLRLAAHPELMNSAGNPVHYLGLSWAGALGEPAAAHAQPSDVASASGAAMACRRQIWQDLGGLCPALFAYGEDAELSLRCWQRGLRVVYVPDAVVVHHYEFHRHPAKLGLVERNRLFMLLTVYQWRTLALLFVPLLGLELAVLATALRQGWWRQLLHGWGWLLTHRGTVRSRRACVQAARRRTDRELAGVLTGRFDPGAGAGIAVPPVLSWLAEAYWRAVRPLL
jgi:GT2 family glycosyltransferase